jgi:hypothetical protein
MRIDAMTVLATSAIPVYIGATQPRGIKDTPSSTMAPLRRTGRRWTHSRRPLAADNLHGVAL